MTLKNTSVNASKIVPELEGEIEPCHHMTDQINSLADDTLKGPIRLYTQIHVLHCSKCRPALSRLRALRTRLIVLRELPPEVEKNVLPPARQSALLKAMKGLEMDMLETNQPESNPKQGTDQGNPND